MSVEAMKLVLDVQTEREAFESEMRCNETWGHRSLKKRPDGRYQNWQVDLMWDVWKVRAALSQQPTTPEPVAVCPTCGSDEPYTGACGTSGSDTKALCKRRTHPAHSVFLVRDIASLLGVSVPDVCNVLVALGYEPRRSTNAAISPDEALAVASRISPAPSVPDDVALTIHELRHLADKFSEGWHEGIKIDAMGVMLLSDAARKLEIMQAAMLAASPSKKDGAT